MFLNITPLARKPKTNLQGTSALRDEASLLPRAALPSLQASLFRLILARGVGEKGWRTLAGIDPIEKRSKFTPDPFACKISRSSFFALPCRKSG